MNTSTTDIISSLLRGTPRYWNSGEEYIHIRHINVALSRALDPALTERTGEVSQATLIADGLESLDWSNTPIGHKVLLRGAVAALRGVPTLLAQNAALRAERDEARKQLDAEREFATMFRRQRIAAEAEVEKLREALGFYANWDNWMIDEREVSAVDQDEGKIARAALTTEGSKS